MKELKNIFVNGPITAEQISKSIQAHSQKKQIGAHSIFLGQVREDENENGKVQLIRYTTYEQMALEKASEIREEIFSKYELSCMHIYHSIGDVLSGEICLFVFVSSKHRKASTDACTELVERIKKDLPVWGEEIFEHEKNWKINT